MFALPFCVARVENTQEVCYTSALEVFSTAGELQTLSKVFFSDLVSARGRDVWEDGPSVEVFAEAVTLGT